MKTTIRWGMAVVAAGAILTGCGNEEPPEAFAAREAMRAEVAGLGRKVEDLRAEMESIRLAHTTDLKAAIRDAFGAEMDRAIVSQVQARVEARIGTAADIDRIFRESIADAMAQYETNKQLAEDVKREEQRIERERERAERDEERWVQLAQELRMTAAQTDQLRAATQAVRAEIEVAMAAIREGQRPEPDVMRARAVELKTQFELAVHQILSPDQVEAYKAQGFSVLRMLEGMSQGGGMMSRGFDSRRRGGESSRDR